MGQAPLLHMQILDPQTALTEGGPQQEPAGSKVHSVKAFCLLCALDTLPHAPAYSMFLTALLSKLSFHRQN